jgi:carbamoyl-phosphate synthase large subunit
MTESPRVIVTGAGGPAGVAVIRSLLPRAFVVAVDSDDDAVGLSLAHKGVVLPVATDEGFVDALCSVAMATEAEVVVCTVTDEMPALYAGSRSLLEAGAAMWVPHPCAVRRCVDKWEFARATSLLPGVPTPATALASADGVPGPWLVKPRYGRGSRDIVSADDLEDLRVALRRVPDPIVQHRVTGREFTVDVLTDRRGDVLVAVPRWRLATRGGISTHGRTFRHRQLHRAVQRLVRGLGATGALNVQGFFDTEHHLWFTEVNPRFSGGLPLTLAAGADVVGEFVSMAGGKRPQPERLHWRSGVTMLRYFEDVFVG